ncbi:hypothetical protein [Variovorax sp. RA8]|uniref:hypothetical protein n=1 Tax=Variovorax sp. (strain JCM 16519 / RA8) TaxID=662548 RepID=UPI0013175F1F|nr:hypothetical protein [Variovorax sp. RA8]VTU35518.1 hypothetical protein RA8CHR_05238 [Variovorax sp. RA8]
MSLTAKLMAVALVLLALAAGAWKILHDADRAGYARAQAEYQARAELQREANRGRAGVQSARRRRKSSFGPATSPAS